MSAISILKSKGAVHLITDGACINADGKLKSIVSKIVISAHQKLAFGVRGIEGAHSVLTNLIETMAPNYDGVKAAIAGKLREFLAQVGPKYVQAFGPHATSMDIFCAGWSDEKNAPDSFLISTFERAGRNTFEVIELDHLAMAPGSDRFQNIVLQKCNSIEDVEALDPVETGNFILKYQRLMKDDPLAHPGEERVTIGGFGQLTTITKDAIITKIIHRWPDKVGEKLSI